MPEVFDNSDADKDLDDVRPGDASAPPEQNSAPPLHVRQLMEEKDLNENQVAKAERDKRQQEAEDRKRKMSKEEKGE